MNNKSVNVMELDSSQLRFSFRYALLLFVLFLVVPIFRQSINNARQYPHPHSGFVAFFYDSSPNYIAACFSPTVLLLLFGVVRHRWQSLSIGQWYILCGLICQVGLLLWEGVQPIVNGATFDWGDVLATFLGGITWMGLWYLLRPDKHLKVVQTSPAA